MSGPPLKAIVGTDFVALVAALAVPITLALSVVVALGLPVSVPSRVLRDSDVEAMDPRAAWMFLAMLPGVALIAGIVLALRVRAIRGAFAGPRVAGFITRVRPFKDRAWVSYRWTVQSKEYNASRLVHLNARTKKLQEGNAVTIALHPVRPSSGWIVQAFVVDETSEIVPDSARG